MRQYQVPQFIDIEDKIIGPLTIRQFIYLVGGGAIAVMAFYTLNFFFFILVATPVALLALALAFYTVNGIPFRKVLFNAIAYFTKPHLYIWKQRRPETKKALPQPEKKEISLLKTPTLSESKLQDLAWSLDIKEKLEE
ncbi:MAG: hypothetical protein UY75_C0027G0006 [Parcubacteria group bacterium GW2011_GWC2_52_8c]|nr:MAG: hypothetical protein UY64_C0012G0002 [Parcubacteria group bacterium GW2011_GWA1_51_12]KKW30629.1 MAG: hypothetical protein UY75_C0027G0006 [Parcubacteria group bacterium GW2011_GWC2_52_8c]